jgi:hypothetical protein
VPTIWKFRCTTRTSGDVRFSAAIRGIADIQPRLLSRHSLWLAIVTWRSDDEIPFFRELRHVAERHLGPIMEQRFSFGDAGPFEELLRDAGFHEVRARAMSRVIRCNDAATHLQLNTMALVGMSAAAEAMDERERGRVVDIIVSESVSILRPYRDGSGLAFEASINLATAKS